MFTLGLTTGSPASASDSGGVISTDTTWTADHGPYTVATPVQIPTGITLTVMPGTVIHVANGGLFRIAGTLNIDGSADQPVLIDGAGSLTQAASDTFTVNIDHADISGYAYLFESSGRLGSHVSITNSRVHQSTPIESASWAFAQGALTLDRNEFVNVAPIFVMGRVSGPVPASITNNRFVYTGTNASSAQLTLPPTVTFTGNSFSPGTSTAVAGSDIFADSPVHVNATRNYWGTTDPTAIAARIDDYNDNISNNVVVDFNPYLSSPPAATQFTPLPPAAPTAVRGPKSATISWTAPVSDGGSPITGYTVTASPGGATATVGGDARTATVTGLTDGTAYTFTVAATNAIGTSGPSPASAPVTPASPPGVPVGVTATAGDGQAVVSWNPPAEGADTVTGYTVASSPGGRTVSVSGSALTGTVTGLTNGTAYTFTVTAKNAVGPGSASDASNAVTPVGKPDRVAKPTVTVKKTTVTLTWKAPDDNGSPISQYVVSGGKAGSKTVTAPTTKAVFKGLKKGSYSFTVVATNAVGSAPASAPVKVVIK